MRTFKKITLILFLTGTLAACSVGAGVGAGPYGNGIGAGVSVGTY